MNLLAIETSTTHASLALKVGEQVWEAEEQTLKKHAEWVLEAIHDLLSQAKIKLTELDGIVFDEGPGSFTGLRIACSIAKGLAIGSNLPLYPVSSLEAIGISAKKHPYLLVMLDARMDEWYWAWFAFGKQISDIQVSRPECISLPAQQFWLAGAGYEALIDNLPMDVKTQLLGTETVYPLAKKLIEVVMLGCIDSVNAREAKPKYVRQQVASPGGKHG